MFSLRLFIGGIVSILLSDSASCYLCPGDICLLSLNNPCDWRKGNFCISYCVKLEAIWWPPIPVKFLMLSSDPWLTWAGLNIFWSWFLGGLTLRMLAICLALCLRDSWLPLGPRVSFVISLSFLIRLEASLSILLVMLGLSTGEPSLFIFDLVGTDVPFLKTWLSVLIFKV